MAVLEEVKELEVAQEGMETSKGVVDTAWEVAVMVVR